MLTRRIFIVILIFIAGSTAFAQVQCDGLGQNPGTAFPVCGTDIFKIADVPICGDKIVPAPCNSFPYSDKNPFWYKFTCFTSGALGFQIKPNTISDDYDWQLFDITGKNPNDVYTDQTLFVACNWSGDGGITGAGSDGNNLVNCDGYGIPLFSKMPLLVKGHDYLLLVSHFSDSQSGYSLFFSGGTANITDPVEPSLLAARAACDGTKINVKLNKQMKCSSLATNGSDFSISPAIAGIISAEGVGCNAGFDMDSIVITLDAPLPPGNYTVRIETGTDNNNLLDNCGRGIPDSQSLSVTVYPVRPTPMDSIVKTSCAPTVLELVFPDPMYCNSIAEDGSDFIVTGSTPVMVTNAKGICLGGFTKVIQVILSSPIQVGGSYRIQLQTGTDGNTIINECGVETAAGSFLNFTTVDTVSALFNPVVIPGCKSDNVRYTHDGRNGVNNWRWSFDNIMNSISKDTVINYTTFGDRQATLIVTNGTCSDTATATITLDPHVKAAFETAAVICPGDPAQFVNTSTGPISSWSWSFGNGNVSTLEKPAPQYYPYTNTRRDIPLQLIVRSNAGCADTTNKIVTAVGNCYIAVPKGFSPNNDGLNDFLYPTNAYKARDLLFRVYNRGGQLIFETRTWTNKWDGTFKGNPQDPGTYVWILSYTNSDSGKRFELKGSTVLIR